MRNCKAAIAVLFLPLSEIVNDFLNTSKSVIAFKKKIVSELSYAPKTAESKEFLLNCDIGQLLHFFHFYRQRFIPVAPRSFVVPPSVRNNPLYTCNRDKIAALRKLIEDGGDLSGFLSSKAHDRALDLADFQKTRNFNESRDALLVCEGFYHLHLEALPLRTNELLVVDVFSDVIEAVGIFTHEIFSENSLNPAYKKYRQDVKRFLKRRHPNGAFLLGGPGGGLQNAAGSSVESTFWQIHCIKTL